MSGLSSITGGSVYEGRPVRVMLPMNTDSCAHAKGP